ncbi:hypothetical protein Y032_0093g2678 [Ancylostoma ceylanicum]|uniref:Uncharacterized protein n=1 Tax=Ancylostoma ceylanicum TaxID=53326 RepID=A0A016TLT0_9BILA|nr:hypothetical protein Y032_0093g2678 [Ancylostoma ceylanicum]
MSLFGEFNKNLNKSDGKAKEFLLKPFELVRNLPEITICTVILNTTLAKVAIMSVLLRSRRILIVFCWDAKVPSSIRMKT